MAKTALIVVCPHPSIFATSEKMKGFSHKPLSNQAELHRILHAKIIRLPAENGLLLQT